MKKINISFPKKKLAIITALIIGVILIYLFASTLTGPNALELYFEDGDVVEPNDSNTLIVDYTNIFDRDISTLEIEVKSIHQQGITFPENRTAYEENIAKGQLRQFKFPVELEGLRQGSTYAFEVTASSDIEDVTKRVSLRIKGGD